MKKVSVICKIRGAQNNQNYDVHFRTFIVAENGGNSKRTSEYLTVWCEKLVQSEQ